LSVLPAEVLWQVQWQPFPVFSLVRGTINTPTRGSVKGARLLFIRGNELDKRPFGLGESRAGELPGAIRGAPVNIRLGKFGEMGMLGTACARQENGIGISRVNSDTPEIEVLQSFHLRFPGPSTVARLGIPPVREHQVGASLLIGFPGVCRSFRKGPLAYLKPSEIETVLSAEDLPRYTEHTVTDPDLFRAQLKDIRAAGYVVSEGEVDMGVRGVAAPIFGTNEQVIAGISVAGPTFRLHDAALPGVIAAVRSAAQVISQRLRDLD
jgi:Bacterial transcriptional regulator